MLRLRETRRACARVARTQARPERRQKSSRLSPRRRQTTAMESGISWRKPLLPSRPDHGVTSAARSLLSTTSPGAQKRIKTACNIETYYRFAESLQIAWSRYRPAAFCRDDWWDGSIPCLELTNYVSADRQFADRTTQAVGTPVHTVPTSSSRHLPSTVSQCPPKRVNSTQHTQHTQQRQELAWHGPDQRNHALLSQCDFP